MSFMWRRIKIMDNKEIFEKFQTEIERIEKKKNKAEIDLQVHKKALGDKCQELLDITKQKDVTSAIKYLNDCKEKLKSVEEELYSEIEEFLKKVDGI